MFKCVLKSLSDTELVSVAQEVTKPEILTECIAAQLAAKSNSSKISLVRITLTNEILDELSLRLLESHQV